MMLHDLYNFREKGGNQFWGVLPLSQGRKIFQKMLISIVTEFQYKLQWLWFSVVQNPIHHYFLVAIFVFAMQVCHSPQMLIQRWQFILLFDFGLFQNNLNLWFSFTFMAKTAFLNVKVWVTIEIITDFLFLFFRHFDIQLQTTSMQKNSLRQL